MLEQHISLKKTGTKKRNTEIKFLIASNKATTPQKQLSLQIKKAHRSKIYDFGEQLKESIIITRKA